MNSIDFFNILEHPEGINQVQTNGLKEIINEYPYFQSARVLYLKGLKNEGSYQYNKELKITAAHTTDRSILFDFITSETYNNNFISKNTIDKKIELNNIEVHAPEEISNFISDTSTYNEVLNIDLFEEKVLEEKTINSEEQLAVGKPLEFNSDETHSFNEWLKISSLPLAIERSASSEPEKDTENISNLTDKKTTENTDKKLSNVDLIDKFIIAKPKISPIKKTVSLKNLAQENSFSSNELMTETLAKVYLEQKNYKKAIQAYRILSLKNPEKNSYFADRIEELKKIEINNTK